MGRRGSCTIQAKARKRLRSVASQWCVPGLKTGHIHASSRIASQDLGRLPSEWEWRL